MKKILITGGTTFVSKYVANYFLNNNYDVYVLNRNTKSQVEGVILIKSDRHELGNKLKGMYFDVVVDVNAYNGEDICDLVNALDSYGQYIMISSSAVYPETNPQPFLEESTLGSNKVWGNYGTDKIAAEKKLLEMFPNAYILRPPYLYGAMNNIYREAFIFECAVNNRKFYLPKDGTMKLQFFHVKDLCRFIKCIIETNPENHIFNVGNKDAVTIKKWVEMCYACAGKNPSYVNVYDNIDQRNYFCFYDYEYYLNVDKQYEIMPETINLQDGLKEAFEWYIQNENQVGKKSYIKYIDEQLKNIILK